MKSLNLKLILEAIDKMTSPVRRMKDGFVASLRGMKNATNDFSKNLKFETAFALLVAQEKLEGIGKTLKKVGKEMSQAGSFFTSRISLPIIGFGALAVRQAGQVEQLRMRLQAFTGDADKAGEMVKKMTEMSEKSPFALDDIGEATVQMLAAGYATDKAADRLKFLGDIAAGTRTSLSQMVGVYLDLRTKGKADVGDLTNMSRQGIPIVAQLAKQLKTNEQGVYKLAAGSGISFDQMKKALRALTAEGGAFFEATEKQGESINGVFNELKRTLGDAFSDVGLEIFKDIDIKGKVKALAQFIRDLASAFMKLPQPVKNFLVWGALITAIIGPVIYIFGQLITGVSLLATGLSVIMPVLAAVASAIISFGAALLATPLGWFLVAIAAVAGAAYLIINNWGAVKGFFADLWSGMKEVFSEGVNWVMEKLQPLLDALSYIKDGWGKITDFAENNALTQSVKHFFSSDDDTATEAQQAAAPGTPEPIILDNNSPAMSPGEEQQAAAPSPAPSGLQAAPAQKVDMGGTLKIQIDVDGRLQNVEAKPNDSRFGYSPGTGQLVGATY